MAHMILLVIALIAFLLATIDYPPASASRMIGLGLFLLTLAQLIGGGR